MKIIIGGVGGYFQKEPIFPLLMASVGSEPKIQEVDRPQELASRFDYRQNHSYSCANRFRSVFRSSRIFHRKSAIL